MIKDHEEDINALLADCRDDDPVVRETAASRLSEVGHVYLERVGPALVALLTDVDDSVRHQATAALGILHYSRALPALMEVLREDEDWVVRAGAAEALAELSAPEALDVLQAALRLDEASPVRAYAALAIGLIGDRASVSVIREQLGMEDSVGVKGELAAAALRLGDEQALDTLFELVDDATRDSIPRLLEVIQDLLSRAIPPVMLARGPELATRLSNLGERWSIVAPQAERLLERLTERMQDSGIG